MNIKTPGVYVQEVSLFPASVAEVATAIPAFIGYTEFAYDGDLNPLTTITPAKIKSLVEFKTYFGEGYDVQSYTITLNLTGNIIEKAVSDKQYFMYDAVRQYFDNGGGECYIVSVGSFEDGIDATKLSNGIDALKKFDEPTLLLFPDGVLLLDGSNDPDYSNYGDLQKQALKQCYDLQDRFTILDLMEGYEKEDASNTPIANFRDTIGVNYLKYGAAYYPWVLTNYNVDVKFRQLNIIDTALNPVDIKTIYNSAEETGLIDTINERISETDSVIDFTDDELDNKFDVLEDGIDLIKESLNFYEEKINANSALKTNFAHYMKIIGDMAIAFPKAESIASSGSPLNADITKLQNTPDLIDALENLASLMKNASVRNNISSTEWSIANIDAHFGNLTGDWLNSSNYGLVLTDATIYTVDMDGCKNIIKDLNDKDILNQILKSYGELYNSVVFYEEQAEINVFNNHAFYKGAENKIVEKMCTIPPSGAVAGIYAAVDRTRGVWKAPANVSINAIIGPVVKIDNKDQADLNIHFTGKSVNAIRTFTGKGTLIWGARTLAGNDNEWRYIPVRRFYNMVEESVKKATEASVFEPNDSGTWIKVRAMIENYLTILWRAGALQGAKTEEAFFVKVGLGATMTSDDILNGKMIVEIGMAVVRPAEFIILRFSHKMIEA